MLQCVKLDQPIPSANIYAVEWDEEKSKWTYVYSVRTPVEITDDDMETDLMIYEYISNLHVEIGENQHGDAVNIHFRGLTQYMQILELQRLADVNFRKQWCERWKAEHGEEPEVSSFAIKVLQHRNHSYSELEAIGIHCISFLMESGKDADAFAVC